MLLYWKMQCILMNKYFDHDVLYVFYLPLNLPSIVQIIRNLKCDVISFVDRYDMQNLVTRRRIGIGLTNDGLYKLPMKIVSALTSGMKLEGTIMLSFNGLCNGTKDEHLSFLVLKNIFSHLFGEISLQSFYYEKYRWPNI